MALAVLLAASAGITVGLTELRQATAAWIVAVTLGSLVVMVQIPAISQLLNLRPLHGADWALVSVAFALVSLMALGLTWHMKRHMA